ncbi:uncharacterized protein BDR25DRAFT_381721 [Lindgomyces ingoldianus]|uniref:Uncharacterized protein n=1 Tax=Lindgomyces ingoldianus TaxID=673940 RepID=A0ACB6QD71_9PLEO|nr:uncharacterized protein BDR25DRAFT_381721 [Lindgomyces ingoldianus]KAF2464090.1 hypothetical protein BDR25DRAFT_381721 [Lindgomyces ingoldianus]
MHPLHILPIASLTAAIAQAPNFAITAKLSSSSSLIAIQGWNLTHYHFGACYNYAVFTSGTGRTFYANGTADEFSTHTSNLLSDDGSPFLPWGLIVSAPNATDNQGRRNVYINCGPGTSGVQVKTDGSFPMMGKGPRVVYGTGEFYVCKSNFVYGLAIALYYREAGEETPARCSNVELQTQCLDDRTEHPYQQDSWCYKSLE